MNIFTKINHLSKKNALSLGAVFLIFMNIVMLVTIISMTAYFMQMTKNLIEKSNLERQTITKSISNVIYSAAKQGYKTKDFSTFGEIMKKMIDNKLINFVVIYDWTNKNYEGKNFKDNSNVIAWSNIKEVIGKKLSVNDVTKIYKEQNPYESNIMFEQGIVSQKINIYIAYTVDTNLSYYIKDISTKNPTLAIIFIMFGSICSLFMIKLIIVPITSLTNGVKLFSKGDFKHKIPMTYYKELNILIRAFNEMASIIYRTHTSLEDQINERTLEISEKNNKLNDAMNELKQTQAMLVHAEKMRSLGELVAGITHEINNPVNFIYGNLIHLKNYVADLMSILEQYDEFESDLSEEHKQKIKEIKEEIDLEFLKDDLPELIRSCQEGTERTKNIVLDLKNFSRLEEAVINNVDLPREIDTTLNILHNKFKNKITVHKEYQENLPYVEGFGGQLNQVFMNILDNAAFAIKEKGDVWIRLKADADNAIIEFEDNGCGMDEKTVKKVFDPFFTTKEVGQGTGLGMAISYKVIKNHQGSIELKSKLNEGTKFVIKLPLRMNKDKKEVME